MKVKREKEYYMKTISQFLLVLILSLFIEINTSTAGGQSIFDTFDTFLRTYVNDDGLVNYSLIRQEPMLLNRTVNGIAEYNVAGKSEDELKAFYINAYNVLVIKQLVDNDGIKSPLKVKGFFDKNLFIVAGNKLTLNELEKEKIIKQFNDPRAHFILVCGAMGCPPLLNMAYFPNSLEKIIVSRTKKALNSSFIKIDKKIVKLSKIFEWYSGDFSSNGSNGVIDYINKFRNTPIDSDKKIVFYEYDWNINEM